MTIVTSITIWSSNVEDDEAVDATEHEIDCNEIESIVSILSINRS